MRQQACSPTSSLGRCQTPHSCGQKHLASERRSGTPSLLLQRQEKPPQQVDRPRQRLRHHRMSSSRLAVVFSRCRIVVAGSVVRATRNLCVVTNAVAVGVGLTRTAALAEGVKLVAVAVAIASWDMPNSRSRRSRQDHCRGRKRQAHQHSRRCRHRCRPSASASQGPPHSPRASSWLPSQSQSPAGMPEHPQS